MNIFSNVSNTVRKMILVMLVSALVMAVGGGVASMFIEVIEPIIFGIGVFLSTAVNIVKVIWLERAVETASAMEDGQMATNHVRKHYLLRFAFTAAVLVSIAITHVPNLLWGALFGLFTFHPAKYALPIIIKGEEKENTA